ncbi:MAG: hypothetical protein IT423_20235 [Pirellulaceae bacterium]|nr:hypothetical protein [Pirellulaceae bacterium]
MRALYLFEFCDQTWIPSGARECLYEVMEACNSGLRSFNREVAEAVLEQARSHGAQTIIELGAGRAPVTSELAKMAASQGMRLVPCDLVPNVAMYQQLAKEHADRVFPIYSSVDLTQPQTELNNAVLVMAGMMHHIPLELRGRVLGTLSATNSRMCMFEPLRRTWLSMFMAALSFFPAWMLPITFVRRSGTGRRLLWCWLLPIVPFMFEWDGVTSCLRQWTVSEWQAAFRALPDEPQVEYQCGFNSLKMFWNRRSPS